MIHYRFEFVGVQPLPQPDNVYRAMRMLPAQSSSTRHSGSSSSPSTKPPIRQLPLRKVRS